MLLDVSMPDMDGFEAARLIHEHPRFERTPIIFVTGVHFNELDRLKGYKLGAVDYVSVPVVPEILRSKVSVLVELYCKRRELRELNRTWRAPMSARRGQHRPAGGEDARARGAQPQPAARERRARGAPTARCRAEIARAHTRGAGAEGGRPPQGRVPGDARARAAQSAGTDPQRGRADAHEAARRSAAQLGARCHRAAADQPHASGRRSARCVAHHARQDQPDARRRRAPKRSRARSRRCTRFSTSAAISSRVELPEPGVDVFGDPTAPDAGHRQRARQRGEVHGQRRPDRAVRAVPGGATSRSRVRDNGIGIRPELLPHVFELFTQLDRGDGRPQGGLGIGLALVQRLVQMHGGRVSAASEGPGKGSEFVIRLPLLREKTSRSRQRRADRGLPIGRPR